MVTTIALPFFKNGQMIASLIVKACVGTNPCNVVYMPGINTLPLETARNRGLDGVLKKHPNIKIVARQEGKYDLGTARSVMQNILTAQPGHQRRRVGLRRHDGRHRAGDQGGGHQEQARR